jgi:hypothetical protein
MVTSVPSRLIVASQSSSVMLRNPPGRGSADVVHQDVHVLAGGAHEGGWAGRIGQVHLHGLHCSGSRQFVEAGGGVLCAGHHTHAASRQAARHS